jgi:hypothetical protein
VEIADLLAVADRGLADAAIEELSADARVGLSYGAALSAATTALAAAGFRASRERHHERTLDSLSETIGAEPALIGRLHRVRRLRNALTYERIGTVTVAEADDFLAFAIEFRRRIESHLRVEHPNLF